MLLWWHLPKHLLEKQIVIQYFLSHYTDSLMGVLATPLWITGSVRFDTFQQAANPISHICNFSYSKTISLSFSAKALSNSINYWKFSYHSSSNLS